MTIEQNPYRACNPDAQSAGATMFETRGALLPILAIACSALLVAPAAAQMEVSRYFGASVSGLSVGPDGGPFGKILEGPTGHSVSANGSYWSASAGSDETSGGTVQARTSLSLPPLGTETYYTKLDAVGNLRYDFTVEGPDPDALIPISLVAYGGASVSRGGFATAILSFGGNFGYDAPPGNWNVETFGPGVEFNANEAYFLHPTQIYRLIMSAQAHADINYSLPGETGVATASVDPTFTILGDFAKTYHFVGLPASAIGSPVGPAVPEPASWAMFIVGFGIVGSSLRRRKRFDEAISSCGCLQS